MTRLSLPLCGLAIPVIIAVAPAAWAQPAAKPDPQPAEKEDGEASPSEQARALKAQADELMHKRVEYRQALSLYEEAYRLDPLPALLYNRARAHQALEEYPAALSLYERFAVDATPELLSRVPKLQELIEEMKQRTHVLAIESNVDGATLFLGGKEIGALPLAEPLVVNAANDVRVLVEKDGYHRFERRLDLVGGERQTLTVELASLETTGILTVTTKQVGIANVAVDGEDRGNTPAELALKPGEHSITVSRDGYDEATVPIVIKVGQRSELDVPLEPTTPVYEAWWFWTPIGVAVAGGAAAIIAVAATTERDPDQGDIDPGVVAAPIIGITLPPIRF